MDATTGSDSCTDIDCFNAQTTIDVDLSGQLVIWVTWLFDPHSASGRRVHVLSSVSSCAAEIGSGHSVLPLQKPSS